MTADLEMVWARHSERGRPLRKIELAGEICRSGKSIFRYFAWYCSFNAAYLPITNTTKDPGLTLRRGRPPGVVGGVSRYSAALKKIFLVFLANASVRAPGCVLTAPASSYSSAD